MMGSTENEQSNEAPVKSGLKVSSTKTSPILVQLAEGNKENDKGGINEKDVWAVRPHTSANISWWVLGKPEKRDKKE